MNVCKKHIATKIEELKISIAKAKANGMTYEKSEEASNAIGAMFDDIQNFNNDRWESLSEDAQLYTDENQLSRYEDTMGQQLMKVETKYLVTTAKKLVSPAGFDPDSGVYVQTEIAIHTNHRNPKNIPSCNEALRLFTVNA